ncbi:T9SS type A sorting domain-containing protein, partial [candidate division KSB1 bacterium]|nr:T9SS type A sorting domain-containing protein [candidate division KSB1 bacterium]
MKTKFIYFIVGLLFITKIFAANSSIKLVDDYSNKIYVSKKGNDITGIGTIINPYLTIGKAIEKSGISDTIIVDEGIYYENFNLSGNSYIIKSKKGPEKTSISGSGLNKVFRLSNSQLELEGFIIKEGVSDYIGGGIQAISSDLLIENCIFENNITKISDWARGGAIGFNNFDSSRTNNIIIRNCRFENNFASNYGGAMAFKTSGTDSSGLNLLIENCDFINNQSGGIGGFIVDAYKRSFEVTSLAIEGLNSEFNIINCNFSGKVNTAEAVSAFMVNKSKGKLRECLFLPADNEKAGEIHRAIHIGTSSIIEIINCTILKNEFNNNHNIIITAGSNVLIKNSILWGGENQIHLKMLYGTGGILNVGYCDIENNMEAVLVDSLSTLNWGDGNITENPLFCDPENFDYHLKEGSPCVGTGENGIDMGKFGVGCSPNRIDETKVETFDLHLANYPNPFNNSTVIEFINPEAGPVDLKIYDIRGQLVKTLKNEIMGPGYHKVV